VSSQIQSLPGNNFIESPVPLAHVQKVQSSSLFSDELGFCEYFCHLCLFFSDLLAFWENSVSPCLSAPRLTPSPTRMLVTPIFETCSQRDIGRQGNWRFITKKNTSFKHPTHKIRRQGKQESFVFTDWMFLSSSSKKSMELKGIPVCVWIIWKWSVLWVQLANISWKVRKNHSPCKPNKGVVPLDDRWI